jgi:hypothetical protein
MQKKTKEMSKKQLNIGTHHWGQRARIRRARGGMQVMVGSVTPFRKARHPSTPGAHVPGTRDHSYLVLSSLIKSYLVLSKLSIYLEKKRKS